MLFVGLTGGIGSGKSEAVAACKRLGAAVLSTDEVVHELLAQDEVRDLVVERWGDRVVRDGRLDRAAIAEVVFERPDELAWLEGVLFPRVGQQMAAWREQLERSGDAPEVAVVEVPLLFEAGAEDAFDATIAVMANEETREHRAHGRDHRGLPGRTARQLSQEEKARRADFVVRNDGTLEELEESMRAVLETLRARAG